MSTSRIHKLEELNKLADLFRKGKIKLPPNVKLSIELTPEEYGQLVKDCNGVEYGTGHKVDKDRISMDIKVVNR